MRRAFGVDEQDVPPLHAAVVDPLNHLILVHRQHVQVLRARPGEHVAAGAATHDGEDGYVGLAGKPAAVAARVAQMLEDCLGRLRASLHAVERLSGGSLRQREAVRSRRDLGDEEANVG